MGDFGLTCFFGEAFELEDDDDELEDEEDDEESDLFLLIERFRIGEFLALKDFLLDLDLSRRCARCLLFERCRLKDFFRYEFFLENEFFLRGLLTLPRLSSEYEDRLNDREESTRRLELLRRLLVLDLLLDLEL
jgi:hypothetical protein